MMKNDLPAWRPTTECARVTVIVTKGRPEDIPSPPSLLAQLEAASTNGEAIRYDLDKHRRRVAASNEKRVGRATEHLGRAMALLRRKRGEWVQTAKIQAEIAKRDGVLINCGDLGKALRKSMEALGIERTEIRERACWRLPA